MAELRLERPDGFADQRELYANGLTVALTNTDMGVFFMLNGAPVAKLNLSFTTAKSLMTALQEVMEKLERVTAHNIMTAAEVETGIKKLVEDDADVG